MDNYVLAQIRSRKEILKFLHELHFLRDLIRKHYDDPIILHLMEDAFKLFPKVREAYEELFHRENALKLKKHYHNQARLYLIEVVRDFWSVLTKLHRRKRYHKRALRFYRPRGSGALKPPNLEGWIRLARGFIEGDELCIATNRVGMTNPSPEELQEALKRLNSFHYQMDAFDTETARLTYKKLTKETQVLHGRLGKELRHFYRDYKPSTMRKRMRDLGFNFVNTTKRGERKAIEDHLPIIEEVIPGEEGHYLGLEAPNLVEEIEAELTLACEAMERDFAKAMPYEEDEE